MLRYTVRTQLTPILEMNPVCNEGHDWLVGFKKATARNWKTVFELEHGVDEKDFVKFIFIQMSGLSRILTCIQALRISMITVIHTKQTIQT